MGRYSIDFKMMVINKHLENGYGVTKLTKMYNIPSTKTVRVWLYEYNEHGAKGLIKNKINNYDDNYIKNVLQYMKNNNESEFKTAIHFNLSPTTVSRWAKKFSDSETENIDMPKKSYKHNTSEDLEKEVERLRMENEYLKKLNALVQKRVKQENKKK